MQTGLTRDGTSPQKAAVIPVLVSSLTDETFHMPGQKDTQFSQQMEGHFFITATHPFNLTVHSDAEDTIASLNQR